MNINLAADEQLEMRTIDYKPLDFVLRVKISTTSLLILAYAPETWPRIWNKNGVRLKTVSSELENTNVAPRIVP